MITHGSPIDTDTLRPRDLFVSTPARAADVRRAFLRDGAIAVVGVSRSGKKFGNAACRTLRDKGYRVYPIHPSATMIDGERCYARIADLPEPVTSLLIVVPPEKAVDVIAAAAADGIRHVWLQQGAESAAAIQLCQKLGLTVTAGECVLMYAEPTGVHKAHAWLHRLFHREAPAA
jgi:uncharacterized protein